MTLKVVLHGMKNKHEIYYINDIFMCRFTNSVECTYDFTTDSHIFMFYNMSRESMNEIVATVDRQLMLFNYEYITEDEDLGFMVTTKYCVRKKEDSNYVTLRMPPRGSAKSYLNECFGVTGNSGYSFMNHKSFKMYSGIERATGKFKTTVVWGDGHKETVTATKPIKGYTPVMIFAYALAKKKFRTNSHFKRYVDNHTEEFGEFYIFYDNATYRQATVKKTDKKYDIYDMAALSIAIMEYGSLKKLEERVEEAMK